MSGWERKIIDTFISRYFASAPETGTERGVLRLRSAAFFPDFDSAASDEKLSYLEAAESLEQKGILKINWEKRGRGERIKTMNCACFEALFEIAGRPFPRTEAEEIRAMLGAKAIAFNTDGTEQIRAALEFLSHHFGPREAGQGMDRRVMEDFVRLLNGKHPFAVRADLVPCGKIYSVTRSFVFGAFLSRNHDFGKNRYSLQGRGNAAGQCRGAYTRLSA